MNTTVGDYVIVFCRKHARDKRWQTVTDRDKMTFHLNPGYWRKLSRLTVTVRDKVGGGGKSWSEKQSVNIMIRQPESVSTQMHATNPYCGFSVYICICICIYII